MYAAPLIYFLLFGIFGEWSRDEVARVTSPSGRVDAVLYETNGGATTSFGYEVWVVSLSASVSRSEASRYPTPAYLYGAVRSSRAYGVNLRWENRGTIVIEYLEARDVVQNVSEVRVGGESVRVVLRPGVEDPTAPAGGMLYNRERAMRAGDPRSAPETRAED